MGVQGHPRRFTRACVCLRMWMYMCTHGRLCNYTHRESSLLGHTPKLLSKGYCYKKRGSWEIKCTSHTSKDLDFFFSPTKLINSHITYKNFLNILSCLQIKGSVKSGFFNAGTADTCLS